MVGFQAVVEVRSSFRTMACPGKVLLVGLIVCLSVGSGRGAKSANGTAVSAVVEGRVQSYDSYWYNDVQYWWPWFSDLATVIMIKLKIAIGLAAIYAFGDGYYWFKKKPEYTAESLVHGEGFWDKFRWNEPSSFLCGWGHGRRRRRRRNLRSSQFEENHFAEFLFDSLQQYDEECRRRVVCELDFEFRGNPKVYKAIVMYRGDMFRNDGKNLPKRKEHCRKLYGRCRLAEKNGRSDSFGSRKGDKSSEINDFWKEIWPRRK